VSRLGAAGVLLLVLAGSSGASAWWGYQRGHAASEARHTAAGIRAFTQAVQAAARAGEAVAAIGRELAAALEDSRETERTVVVRVREIVDADPEFAAVRRPAELQRLRRDALERIARAAEADQLQR
jgi:hypothetical protein